MKNPTQYPGLQLRRARTNTFTNAASGVVNVSPALASDTTTYNSIPVVNNGTMNLTKGTLSTSVGGLGTGTYNLSAGTTLAMNCGIFDISGATVSGAGTFSHNGGGLKGSPAAANLLLNGGSLVGGGTMTFPVGSSVTLASGSTTWVEEGTTVVNNTTVTQNDANLYLFDGKVTNQGTWTVKNPTQYPGLQLRRARHEHVHQRGRRHPQHLAAQHR